MNTNQFTVNGHTVIATFEVQDHRTEESFSNGDEKAFGSVEVPVGFTIDGNGGYTLILQNDGDGELSVGNVNGLSCKAEYKRILSAISWPVDEEFPEDVESRADYVLDEALKEIIAAAQIVFDKEIK